MAKFLDKTRLKPVVFSDSDQKLVPGTKSEVSQEILQSFSTLSKGLEMNLKFKRLDPRVGNDWPIPEVGTPGSAGVDLRACLDQTATLSPGRQCSLGLGLQSI